MSLSISPAASSRFLSQNLDIVSLLRSTNLHACRRLTDLPLMRAHCEVISRSAQDWQGAEHAKAALAVAAAECHVARFSHSNMKSCQDEEGDKLTECIKDMNRDQSVMLYYTQFYLNVDLLCGEVDRGFTLRRSQTAIDAVVGATDMTAKALRKLQVETFGLTSDLHQRVHESSAALMDALKTHSDAETARFRQLSTTTSAIADGQKTLIHQLAEHGGNLRTLLQESEGTQLLINATSASIVSTQREIMTLQNEAKGALDETQMQLVEFKTNQAASFQATLDALTTLHGLSTQLALAQREGNAAVAALSEAQAVAFAKAEDALGQLAAEQSKAFQQSHEAMAKLAESQRDIQSEQTAILHNVKTSGVELSQLAEAQKASFAAASANIDSLHQQAAAAHDHFSAMMGELRSLTQQVLNINLDMLRQLFKIESTLFYIAFVPMAYLLTATHRTAAARFYIYSMLLSILLAELFMVDAARRFNYPLSSTQFELIRLKLRHGLLVLSGLSIILSALLYVDYSSETHRHVKQTASVVDKNYSMLQQLIDRTQHLASGEEVAKQGRHHRSQTAPCPSCFSTFPMLHTDGSMGVEQLNPGAEGESARIGTLSSFSPRRTHMRIDSSTSDGPLSPSRGMNGRASAPPLSPIPGATNTPSPLNAFQSTAAPHVEDLLDRSQEIEEEEEDVEGMEGIQHEGAQANEEDEGSVVPSPTASPRRSTRSRSRSRSRSHHAGRHGKRTVSNGRTRGEEASDVEEPGMTPTTALRRSSRKR